MTNTRVFSLAIALAVGCAQPAAEPLLASSSSALLPTTFLLDEPSEGPSHSFEQVMGIAHGGDRYAVLWQDADYDGRLTQVSADDGHVLSEIKFGSYENVNLAAVAFDGQRFRVVWSPSDDTSVQPAQPVLTFAVGLDGVTTGEQLLGEACNDKLVLACAEHGACLAAWEFIDEISTAGITADGQPGESQRLALGVAHGLYGFSIAWHASQFVLASEGDGSAEGYASSVWLTRLADDGTKVAEPFPVANYAAGSIDDVALASNGRELVVGVNRGYDGAEAFRLNAELELLSPVATPLGTIHPDTTHFSLASDGADFLFAFQDKDDRSYVLSLSSEGEPGERRELTLDGARVADLRPTLLASDGERYLAVSEAQDPTGAPAVLYLTELDAEGSELSAPHTLSKAAAQQDLLASASNGQTHLVVYRDNREGYHRTQLRAVQVLSDGTVRPSKRILSGKHEPMVSSLRLVSNGTDYLLTYREATRTDRNNETAKLRGVLLDAEGNPLSEVITLDDAAGEVDFISVASDGDSFLVLALLLRSSSWYREIRAVRVSGEGERVSDVLVASGNADEVIQDDPIVLTWTGADYLALWNMWDDVENRASFASTLLSREGALITDRSMLLDPAHTWHVGDLACADDVCLAAFSADRDIYYARLSKRGELLAPPVRSTFAGSWASPWATPSLLWNGETFTAGTFEFNPGAIRLREIAPDGTEQGRGYVTVAASQAAGYPALSSSGDGRSLVVFASVGGPAQGAWFPAPEAPPATPDEDGGPGDAGSDGGEATPTPNLPTDDAGGDGDGDGDGTAHGDGGSQGGDGCSCRVAAAHGPTQLRGGSLLLLALLLISRRMRRASAKASSLFAALTAMLVVVAGCSEGTDTPDTDTDPTHDAGPSQGHEDGGESDGGDSGPPPPVCGPVDCEPMRADCNDDPADGCETDLTQAAHCGGCGRVCDECVDGLCALESVTLEVEPLQLAVDEESFYFETTDAYLWTRPRGKTGEVVQLPSSLDHPYDMKVKELRVRSGNVYALYRDRYYEDRTTLVRTSKEHGIGAVLVEDAFITDMALTDDAVFWSERPRYGQRPGGVYRRGLKDAKQVELYSKAQVTALGVADDLLAWSEANGRVRRGSLSMQTARTVASGMSNACAMDLAESLLLGTCTPGGGPYRVTADGSAEPLAATEGLPRAYAFDATDIYWITWDPPARPDDPTMEAWFSTGKLWGLPKRGGRPVLLAKNLPLPQDVTVDDGHVYVSAGKRILWTPKLASPAPRAACLEPVACSPDAPCAACPEACADSCHDGLCEPETLDEGLRIDTNEGAVLVHEERVYYLTQGHWMAEDPYEGAVRWLPTGGGEPQVLASGLGSAQGLLVREGHVYFRGHTSETGGIFRSSLERGGRQLVVPVDFLSDIYGFTADDEWLYWQSDDGLSGDSLGGGHGHLLYAYEGSLYNPLWLAHDTLFWWDFDQLWHASRTGEDPEALTYEPYRSLIPFSPFGGHSLVSDENAIYFTSISGIQRRDRATGKLEQLVYGELVHSLAIDDDFVYYTVPLEQGAVRKVPKAGGRAVDVARGERHPMALAVDQTHVYWLSAPRDQATDPPSAQGMLRRAPK